MITDNVSEEIRAGLLDPTIMGPPTCWLASAQSDGITDCHLTVTEFANNYRPTSPSPSREGMGVAGGCPADLIHLSESVLNDALATTCRRSGSSRYAHPAFKAGPGAKTREQTQVHGLSPLPMKVGRSSMSLEWGFPNFRGASSALLPDASAVLDLPGTPERARRRDRRRGFERAVFARHVR